MQRPTRTAVVLFARAPAREEKVLGLGRDADRRALSSSLAATLQALAQTSLPLVVVCDGSLDDACRTAGARPTHVFLQEGSSFEDRLLHGVAATAALGYERIVLVGSDTPDIDVEDLRAAADADGRVVVGPSLDGGVWLLGLDVVDVPLLAGLPWRTSHVRDEIAARAAAAGVPQDVLDQRRDVDSAADARAMLPLLDRLARRFLGRALLAGAAPGQTPHHVVTPLAAHPASPAVGPPRAR